LKSQTEELIASAKNVLGGAAVECSQLTAQVAAFLKSLENV
jgi:hypothetical protein